MRPRSLVVPLALAVPAVTASAQQTRVVTGTVTSAETNTPLADVTISVVGSTTLTRTNERGQFRIAVPAGNVTLVARALGYRRTPLSVPAGQTTAAFSLAREALQLGSVIVTGAATTASRATAVTAVSQVSAQELARVPSVSFENALQGKVVGASINMNNGAPGGGGQIQIRGITSLLGNFQPLFVVDGTIVSNGQNENRMSVATGALNNGEENTLNRIADLNPNDIESVEVLKSAAATAIYGSQATNGVIVITTKRGASGAPRLSVTQRVGAYSVERDLGMRRFQSVADAVAAAAGGATAGGDTTIITQIAAANGGRIPYYDYIGQFYQTRGPSYETIGSLSGGTERTKYYVSGFVRDEVGTAPSTGARKYSALANVDQSFGDRWTLSVKLNALRDNAARGIANNDNSNSSPQYAFACTLPIIDLAKQNPDGTWPVNPFCGGPSLASNPWATFYNMRNDEDTYRQIGSGQVNYTVFRQARQNLRLNLQAGYDRYGTDGYVLFPPTLQFQWQSGTGGPGLAAQSNSTSLFNNTSLNAIHTYTPGFSWLASATTSAGLQLENRTTNFYYIDGTGLTPTLTNATAGAKTDVGQDRERLQNQAFYANEELELLADRLRIQGGVRGERSSVNGDPYKLFFFPRAGASYRFVDPIPYVSEVKLRASTGQSGNQPNLGYRDITLTNFGLITGQPGFVVSGTVGNQNIQPERLRENEYGVDLGLLHDRVRFEGTYYDRKITNLLLPAAAAPSTGVTTLYINGGRLATWGTELAATVIPVQTRNFTWTWRTNYTQFHSFVDALAPGVQPFTPASAARGGFGNAFGQLRFSPGTSISAIWGNRTLADGTLQRATVLADANPKYTMQFLNDFQYKQLSFNFLLDWRNGGYVSNVNLVNYDAGYTAWDYDKVAPDGSKLGAYRYAQWNGGHQTSVYLMRGTYLKLREVNLAYALPSSYARLVHTRDLRLSVAARNLFIKTPYDGYDPEVNNGGNYLARFVDLAPWPPSRSVFFSIDVGI